MNQELDWIITPSDGKVIIPQEYTSLLNLEEGDVFVVKRSDNGKHVSIILPDEGEEEMVEVDDEGEIEIPEISIPLDCFPSEFQLKAGKTGFHLIPNKISVGKGYFATTDVFLWKGDVDKEGEDVDYDSYNLRETYQLENDWDVITEEGMDYCLPWNGEEGNPYETLSPEEWVVKNYSQLEESCKSPILVRMWFRRYSTIETEDYWETYYSTDYGDGDWGSEDYLLYQGKILTYPEREKLSEEIIFPYPYKE